jgi:hypothetical protein
MRPYPWYEVNGLTLELEQYAAYAFERVQFERLYQPEPNRLITPRPLLDSVGDDEERYGWMSGDPIMRDMAHMLWCDPGALTKRARINAAYMNGFKCLSMMAQARIHVMTACLSLGSYTDTTVTKKDVKGRARKFWARAWLRHEKIFSPSTGQLNAALKRLPDANDKTFHWEVVLRDLGLSDLAQSREQDQGPGQEPLIA